MLFIDGGIMHAWINFTRSHDPFVIDYLIPYGGFVSAYFLFSLPYFVLDIFGDSEKWASNKVQHEKNFDTKLLQKSLPVVLFNLLVIGSLFEYFIYYLRRWRGCHTLVIPDSPQMYFAIHILHAMIMAPMHQVIFYYIHRFIHTPIMYKRFHKMHHEWTSPISIAAFYNDPVDHILSNCLPMMLPPLIVGADCLTIFFWYLIVIYIIICHHSGYDFKYMTSPRFHDYHHKNFTKNFGAFYVMDALHGTLEWSSIESITKEIDCG